MPYSNKKRDFNHDSKSSYNFSYYNVKDEKNGGKKRLTISSLDYNLYTPIKNPRAKYCAHCQEPINSG